MGSNLGERDLGQTVEARASHALKSSEDDPVGDELISASPAFLKRGFYLQLGHGGREPTAKGEGREYQPGEEEDRKTAKVVCHFGEADCTTCQGLSVNIHHP